jgi:YHS domain-containing protein
MKTAMILLALGGLFGCSKAIPRAFAHEPEAAKAADDKAAPIAFDKAPAFGTTARCAVTHETFTVTAKTATATYQGKTYVFCCPECKPTFEKDPAKFAAQK